ncbi:protein TPX2-like [Quillaja saponaria]|uniref:Protein TPX2-like n=1 Tax=Quillaja saponaria TaxID=32244 RepID=A0AAD7Q694_QUISA|nr:protein TPX2-like [Quillaja saponaria]
MDEDLEEFVAEPFVGEEIDPDYEFDAPCFYDFNQPETYWEALETESWFEYAGNYPPSPFVLKMKWREDIPVENVKTSDNYRDACNLITIGNDSGNLMNSVISITDDDSRGSKIYNQMAQDIPESKTRLHSKSTRSRSSNLMKPTASHLAKQNKPREVYYPRYLSFQTKLGSIDGKSSHASSVIYSQSTKRQKIEAGYLRKGSHLKHQTLLLHKTPNKVGLKDVSLVTSRPKITIPKEPELETAHRAQRHRSKINAEPGGHAKSNVHMFKARPLNRKILEAPSLPLHKKSTPQRPEFHLFHLKTLERAMQHTSNDAGNVSNCNYISQSETMDIRSPNSTNAFDQEKRKLVSKLKGGPFSKILTSKPKIGDQNIKQELKFRKNKVFADDPPIELFGKLSLASEVQQTVNSQSKEYLSTEGSKENRPRFIS